MYTPGKLIYFNPFYFKDGSPSKPKYFLVLKVINGSAVLASLPSSVDYVPRQVETKHGCIEIPEGCFNCYVFKSNNIITTCGWSFPLDTYLYGQWIDEFTLEQLDDTYPLQDIDYRIIGELTKDELTAVIGCFTKSSVVKRKFKRLLGD